MNEVEWFHSIDLGDGVVTPGSDDTAAKLDAFALPDDLKSKTVLDVGAWDGFFSFEAERRGAERVLAVDSFAWHCSTGKAGFDLSREVLGSRVEAREIEVEDISRETVGTFDVVLLLGVLYHMRHPVLVLERMAEVTDELLVLETHVDLVNVRGPAMAYYPGEELNGDWTNWWGPNPSAVCAMLENVGFRTVEIVSPNSRGYRVGRALRRGLRHGPTAARQGRLVVHARK